MPCMDGRGPAGAGPMTGRVLGACAGGRGAGRGCGPGWSRGIGHGFGAGQGPGRRAGWFSVGYGQTGEGAATNMKSALEERRDLLRAELERAEDLLKKAPAAPGEDKEA